MVDPVYTKPSSLIGSIKLEQVERHTLFKFTDDLQLRMEQLLSNKKADKITPDELAELEAIGELDQIFTHISAMLVANK
ncbi:MAG: hypothetical protein AAGE84_16935 [Cyanobacteria bacterium P01_G01_bin.39]